MKTLWLAFCVFLPTAFAAEEKKGAPEPWASVDQELTKGAKKIKGLLEKNQIPTEEKGAPPVRKEERKGEELRNETTEGDFARKLNSAWDSFLKSVNGLLATQRQPKKEE